MAMLAADVSKYLGWEQDITLELAERAPKSYRRYFIEKKRGGKRAIFHPSKKTKAIQYALMNLFLSKVPIHKAAMGYVAKLKSPLRTNAEQHAKYSYNMRLDMKNFFPSIIPDDLFNKIQSMIELTDENRTFLRNVLFIAHPKEGIGLAIGAPSSPIISNIVMIDLDELFCNLVKSKDGVYTRYSDDMMFSVHQKGECNEILEEVRGVLGSTDSPNLELNEEKTYFMSRKTRRVITGVFITPDGTVSVGRKNKRYVRKLLHQLSNHDISDEDLRYLQGYLAFLIDVEPEYLNNLALKYGGEIIRQALLRE